MRHNQASYAVAFMGSMALILVALWLLGLSAEDVQESAQQMQGIGTSR